MRSGLGETREWQIAVRALIPIPLRAPRLGSSSYPRGVDWHMPLDVAPLYCLLDDAVAKYGALPCTNFLGKILSYAEIGALVDQAAAGPADAMASRKAPKSACFCPTRPTFIIYYFADAESRRHGRQLQSALYARGADLPGQGQRHRDHGDARSQAAVRQGRGAAAVEGPSRARSCARSPPLLPAANLCCSGCSTRRSRGRCSVACARADRAGARCCSTTTATSASRGRRSTR